jgi:acyl carrier protein
MEKKDYISWIISWFQKKSNVLEVDLQADFFSSGLLDSFKTLELITDIETSLKISLPDSALTDTRFYNINGLADILSEIKHFEEADNVE